MPRTLPWLTGADKRKETAQPRQPRKRRSYASSDIVNSDLDVIGELPSSPKRKSLKAAGRDASSSPISRPPPARPDVSFMREGFAADDIFIMVEDEFDHTARLFTQHIHAAEYERLKRLHKSRGADTLAQIKRATDGKTVPSKELGIALEQEEMAGERQDNRPKKAESDSDDEDDPYMQDPQLAGLMAGSQQSGPGRELKAFAKAKSHTRAAAGFTESPNKASRHRDALAEEGRRRAVSEGATTPREVEDDETDEYLDEDLNTIIYDTKKSVPEKQSSPKRMIKPYIDRKLEVNSKASSGLFKAFAKPKDGNEDVRNEAADCSQTAAAIEACLSPERRPRTSATPAPGRSLGGIGSRIAQRLAERQQKLKFQPESLTSRPLKEERPVVIERPPSQENGTASNSDRAQSSSISNLLARQKEIKREEDDMRRRKLDDIPTFLF